MKFESRTVSSCSGFGYVTLIWSGPRTSGTGGSLGFAAGSGAGTRGGTITGFGAEGPVAGRQDAPASATQQAKTLIVEAFMLRILVARELSNQSIQYAWVVPPLDCYCYLFVLIGSPVFREL